MAAEPRAATLDQVRETCDVAVARHASRRVGTRLADEPRRRVERHPQQARRRQRRPVQHDVRAVHLDADGIAPNVADELVLLDAHDPVKHGGTGKTVDWNRAAAIAGSRRVMLAGGLTPLNVREAIETVRPYAVDVASGVESSPGIKDHGLLRAFFAAVKDR